MAYRQINWDEVRERYESGKESVRALTAKYGMSESTLRKHMKAEGWKRFREERERQMMRACLTETARLLHSAVQDARAHTVDGESSVREIKELAGLLQSLVGTAEKLYRGDKSGETEMQRVEVVLAKELEGWSG